MKIIRAEKPMGIHPKNMAMGSVAEIVKVEHGHDRYLGLVVVKHAYGYQTLNQDGSYPHWSNLDKPAYIQLVRPLESGDKIEF